MDWDFNSRPMAITEPPLARSPEPSSLLAMDDYGYAPSPSSKPLWPMPAMASSTSLSCGSLSSHGKTVKCGRGKHSDVELIPQPSDDPDDPLVCSRCQGEAGARTRLGLQAVNRTGRAGASI